MKTALIRGPLVSPAGSLNNEPTPPLGLAYIAASLKQAGLQVQGIDATGEDLNRVVPIPNSKLQYNGIGIDEIVERLEPEARVVGVSCMFSHEWTYYRSLITAIKTRLPDALIIAGGEHCTALPEYTLRDCPALDYIGLGEGEETMVEFSLRVADGGDPRDVGGIAFLDDGDYVTTTPRARIRELGDIPWPDWDSFPVEPYLANNISFGPSHGRNMPALATRGCPFQCTFCSNPLMWTTRYVMRAPEDVVAEIAHYREKYDADGIQFYDLTAIIKKDWTIDFCKLLVERDWDLEWSLPSGTRSEALDAETLGWMARANCRYLVYAPESGSVETLRLIKKKVSLPAMEISVRQAIKNGMTTRTNFIIGFPHETRKQLYQTLKQQMKFTLMGVDEAPLYIFQPYPGTELLDGLIERGEVTYDDEYFESLASFSNGMLAPPPRSICKNIGRFELFAYHVLGMALSYFLSYTLRPKRIVRAFRNMMSSDRSSTVLEQRIKDRLRKWRSRKAASTS